MEKKKIEEMNNKLKLENRVKNAIFTKNNFNSPQSQKLVAENSPKRAENADSSRFSNFVRGFRREHTDFFPSSKRHSAIFSEQLSPSKNNSPQKVQRSSAIFQRNRPKGEPILTDFIPKRDTTLDKRNNNAINGETSKTANNSPAAAEGEVKLRNQPSSSSKINNNHLDFVRMRREKTESVIFVSRNTNSAVVDAYQQFQQQVKAHHIAGTFFLKLFFLILSLSLIASNVFMINKKKDWRIMKLIYITIFCFVSKACVSFILINKISIKTTHFMSSSYSLFCPISLLSVFHPVVSC